MDGRRKDEATTILYKGELVEQEDIKTVYRSHYVMLLTQKEAITDTEKSVDEIINQAIKMIVIVAQRDTIKPTTLKEYLDAQKTEDENSEIIFVGIEIRNKKICRKIYGIHHFYDAKLNIKSVIYVNRIEANKNKMNIQRHLQITCWIFI